jgi:uncharacterized protein DUF2637
MTKKTLEAAAEGVPASWLGRAGAAGAWAISGIAWTVSFASQVKLASDHGFKDWQPFAWALTTDLAGLVGMVLALDQAQRRVSTRGPSVIAVASAGVMIAANVGVAVGDWASMLMHAWEPLMSLICWYVLVHVRRALAPAAGRQTEERPIHRSRGLRGWLRAGFRGGRRLASTSRPTHRTTASAETRLRRTGRLIAREPDITSSQAAKRLGVSKATAARWLKEARELRVVDQVAEARR